MKNRKVCALLAAVTAAGLAFSNVGVAYAAPVTKDETVYVKMDENGNKTSVTVSDEISNIEDADSIQDISSLSDVENVKGDEAFSRSGDELVWENDGSSQICYQGTTETELPVGMTIRYELDGKTMTAEELKGKSGHLKISVQYENHTSGEAYVPFLVVSGIVLDQDVFSNITLENGKLVSDGEREVAVGFGFPGMAEYLGIVDNEALNDLELPEEFSLEADVKDFEKITCMSYATNEIFEDIADGSIDSLDDLQSSMRELSDAANQLVDGSGALREGLDTLVSGSQKLDEGAAQLTDGGNTLKEGMDVLSAGAGQVKGGAADLADGTGALSVGSKSLVSGTSQLAAGSANAKAGAEQLAGGIEAADNGVQNLQAGLAQVKGGIEGISQLAVAASESVPTTATGEVAVTVHVDNRDIRNTVDAQLRAAGANEETITAVLASIADRDVTTTTSATVNVDSTALTAYLQRLQETAASVDTGVAALQTGAGQLEEGMGQLKSGAASLGAGLATLESGAGQVAAGSQALDAGITAADNGAKQLSNGAASLADGTTALSDGTNTLNNGLITLKQGTSDLTEGAKKLDDGAVELNEGMIRFNEDGIQKLVNVFDGNLGELLDRVNGMVDHAKTYDNYSGISEEMKGSVKFIFMTE